jgi:hypothetical protein
VFAACIFATVASEKKEKQRSQEGMSYNFNL